MTDKTIEIGSQTIALSNLDKPFFPETGLTKGDLIDYYRRIAGTMLPHLAGHPLSLQRFPDGIAGQGFYQKEVPDYFPDWIRTETRKEKRNGRIFLDYLRNAYAQTSVAPYGVRPKPGAPVATPLDWEELADSSLHPQRYTLRNIFRRLGQKSDPWQGIEDHARSLEEPRRRLADLD